MRGILVNGRGQRYVAEDTYSGPHRPAHAVPPGQHRLPDHRRRRPGRGDGVAVAASSCCGRPTWVCDTVAELEARDRPARRARCRRRSRAYNEAAARGEDPLLHKKPEWLKPIGSPVGAIDLRDSTGGFTLGGLQTTLDGEVLHVSGEPIPGLYARGPVHGRAGRVGLRQRHLARRRQLLRPPGGPRGRQGLTRRPARTTAVRSPRAGVSRSATFVRLRRDSATAVCYK